MAEFISKEKPFDQKLRYPTDKKLDPWWRNEGFDPIACHEQFEIYRNEMAAVGKLIHESS